MPIHNWKRVDAGLFHAFHQGWTVALCDALNERVLPSDHFALVEQKLQGPSPDVLTLSIKPGADEAGNGMSTLAVATAPPRTRVVRETDAVSYASKANRVTVRHRHGDVVAIIEIVSPGNKGSKAELRAFVEKKAAFLRGHIHVLVIDLLPPSRRDPHGIHKVLWDEFEEEDFDLPADKQLILAAYDAGPPLTAYVEPIAVGDPLPEMPLFLKPETYVPAPLEATYQKAWNAFPRALKSLLTEPAERQ